MALAGMAATWRCAGGDGQESIRVAQTAAMVGGLCANLRAQGHQLGGQPLGLLVRLGQLGRLPLDLQGAAAAQCAFQLKGAR